MPLTFHILDSLAQDITVTETEDTQEIEFPAAVAPDSDSDDEVRTRRRKGPKAPQTLANRKMVIHLFGSTAEGKPVRVNVTGFQPFFYVRLPDGTQKTRAAFESRLGAALIAAAAAADKAVADVETTFVKRKLLFGYTGGADFPFARLAVESIAAFRTVKNIFLNKDCEPIFRLGGEPLEVFEANLDPMLRFFHLRDIQPCGWVTVDDEDGAEDDIFVDWEAVSPCAKPPAAVAPFLVASWDIETYSENGEFTIPKRGYERAAKLLVSGATDALAAVEMLRSGLLYPDSPPRGMDPLRLRAGGLPDRRKLDTVLGDQAFLDELGAALSGAATATGAAREAKTKRVQELLGRRLARTFPLAGDPVIQIGVVLQRGAAKPEKHIFVVGTCDAVEGATVHAYGGEREMLKGFAAAMRRWNPDILLGYNVFGFDENYVWVRAVELGLAKETTTESGWTRTTCDPDLHAFSRLCDRNKEFALETKFLSSSALGDNTMYMWTTHGRLQVDLYHYIKRGYALPSYKLDDTTQHFMSGKLSAVEAPAGAETWTLLTKATADATVGRAVVLLDETGDGVVEKLEIVAVESGKVIVRAPEGDDRDDLALAAQTAVKWAIVKDDVSPQDIFRFHRTGPAERAKVAAYCIQDCVLVLDLYKKLDVFNNSMAMANACSVPVGYIFTRGQGIKIESLIFKECHYRGQAVKVLPSPSRGADGAGAGAQAQEESYEGAIVLDPEPGFYFDSPIGVADFASLYPSTIISENISYDTLVWVKDFNLDGSFRCYALGDEAGEAFAGPGVRWTDITFDIWGSDPADTRKHPAKIKTGLRVCRYAQFPGEEKGTLPQILAKLLATRKAKRKEGEKETDPFRKALLDAEQLAYKLTANSLYGQLGSATFKIRLQHLAASTTAYGRKQIMFAKAAIEKFYGPGAGRPDCCAEAAKIVYGDSVTGDTPLYMKRADGTPFIQRVDDLAGEWLPWHESKEAVDVSDQGLTTWTERGWTPLRRIIRHRLAPGKRMFRILTHTGVVDCTEDHSLVAKSGVAIQPADVKVGTELLHMNDITTQGWGGDTEITAKEAWAMGFFLADGSADAYKVTSGVKYTWAVNKADTSLLETVAKHLPFETKILDTLASSGVYKLVPVGDIKTPTMKYRDLFYNAAREKRVPPAILNAPLEVVREFMAGFYAGDGDKANGQGYVRWDQKGKEVSTGLYILSRRLGYNVSMNDRTDKLDVFRLTLTMASYRKNPSAIKKIRELPTEGVEYVYDLETENHHFAVGPGALVVHNTDSLFVCFNPKNPETGERLRGKEAIVKTMELTEEAGKFVSRCLAQPHDFEYDKVFSPFIIFSKKRYVGNKYEESPEHYSQTSMGIATKRRDYAPLVKVIYGGALRILLTDRDINAAISFVQDKMIELVEGKMSMNLLTMSKSLRAEYKTETPPAHKVLAERIAARDPGNAPASGDRIPFIYVMPPPGQQAAKLQGDRVETPSWIRAKGLKPDYRFYIEHQLLNPVTQLFALVAERIPGVVPPKKGWAAASPGERESATTEAIFRPVFNLCDRIATQQYGAKMFGLAPAAVMAADKPKKVAAPTAATTKPVPKQASISSYFIDKMVLKSLAKSASPPKETATATTNPKPRTTKTSQKAGKVLEV